VVAVQIALKDVEFTYDKWGGRQTGKAGDWLVDNAGDVYTVDAESFARTYQKVGDGLSLYRGRRGDEDEADSKSESE